MSEPADLQIVSAEDSGDESGKREAPSDPVEDKKSLKQFTLRKFFAPQHPEAQILKY